MQRILAPAFFTAYAILMTWALYMLARIWHLI